MPPKPQTKGLTEKLADDYYATLRIFKWEVF